jgi:hypothetical protein
MVLRLNVGGPIADRKNVGKFGTTEFITMSLVPLNSLLITLLVLQTLRSTLHYRMPEKLNLAKYLRSIM